MEQPMTRDRETLFGIPRGPLIGALALVAFAIVVTTGSRLTEVGTLRSPEPAPVESRTLVFKDRHDGAVVVMDVSADQEVAVLPPGTNGFIRGTLRGLARERRMHDIGMSPPFLLTRSTDGRVTLQDPSTGRQIDLDAFGPTNAGAFAKLLPSGKETQ